MPFAYGAAALILLFNLNLAFQVSYSLYLLAILETLAALPLGIVILVRAKKRQRPGALAPLMAAFLSPLPLLALYPFFVNLLVYRVGPQLILQDAATLCRQYDWNQRDKFRALYPSNPLLPDSIRRLCPIYVTVDAGSLSLKMGGMLDCYSGLEIVPDQTPTPVDWSQTWNLQPEPSGDQIRRSTRVIAGGIRWKEWDAP